VTCRVLKFAKQPYYRWLADPVTQRDWDDAYLINAAIDIHIDDPAFGYRFIADELVEDGFTVSERRVWRLCSQMGTSTRSCARSAARTDSWAHPFGTTW